jgi:hypothetical protein
VPARATRGGQLKDDNTEQIADLQTCDRGYSEERNHSRSLATGDASPNGDNDRKQNRWSQDEHGETLTKQHADQKHKSGKQHFERTSGAQVRTRWLIFG